MRKIFRSILTVTFIVLLSSCLETTDEFILNPDGSGKVVHEAVFKPIDLGMSTDSDPEAKLKSKIRDELEKAEGVEVWSDVDFEQLEGDKIYFKGTAYFKDITKLKFHNSGTSISIANKIVFNNDNGNFTLELQGKSGDKDDEEEDTSVVADLTEEEIQAKISETKQQFAQAGLMMTGLLSGVKIERVFTLPGTIQETVNFQEEADGRLRNQFEGQTLTDFINTRMNDDEWIREQIVAGRDVMKDGPDNDYKMNEVLFGTEGPVRVVTTGATEPLFNYESEVAKARENYTQITEKLGVVPRILVDPSEVGDFRVGGVRLIYESSFETDVRPFNYDEGYALSIIGVLPEKALSAKKGKVTVAVGIQEINGFNGTFSQIDF